MPLGYEAYAVVPVTIDDAVHADRGSLAVVEVLLDALARFTGQQPVHLGMWEGWAWWYDTGDDPRTAPGTSVFNHLTGR